VNTSRLQECNILFSQFKVERYFMRVNLPIKFARGEMT
jgi:hypothetical protein